MILPWSPVVIVDIVGSVMILGISLLCANLAWGWTRAKPEDIFRQYIFLLTFAFVFFAFSRSCGHLVKQVLLAGGFSLIWKELSPFSGAVNTITFVVVFAFGIYFHRFRKIHQEIEQYRTELEQLVADRTAELEQANTTLSNVLDSSIPIAITNLNYDLVNANKAYFEIWPLQGTDDKPVKCYESRPGNLCHTDRCPLRQFERDRRKSVIEGVKVVVVEGERREFIFTAKHFNSAGGEFLGIVESFQDVTARRVVEERLGEERERLAVTLRSIGDGVITTDVAGRIVSINRMAEQLTGWSQAEARGLPIDEVFTLRNEQSLQICPNPVDKVLGRGENVELDSDIILIARDGTRRAIADSGAPIRDKDSRIIGAVLVFRDVTERKRLEREVLKNKNIESLGVLAGGIAHDFNNILAAILGNISLAMQDESLDEDLRGLLTDAKKASVRAKGLTQQLLTFSKGGQPVRKTSSLKEVIMDSAEFVLHGEKVGARYRIPDNLRLVEIDRNQISQVIQNIVLNARQAMPEGGAILISCENVDDVSVGQPEDGRWKRFVKISFEDQGIGMSKEVLSRIFEPYFTTKEKGSGLGLTISHSIIVKHGGSISVESTPGKGTTFTILLPASGSPVPLDSVETEIPVMEKRLRVMVMDDEEMVRTVAGSMLRLLGHEVILVCKGEEALEQYRQTLPAGRPIDLIIMDLTIPGGMGGREAVKAILEMDPKARVIVASGYSNDSVMANYKDYGFCGVLLKPFELDELKKQIHAVCA